MPWARRLSAPSVEAHEQAAQAAGDRPFEEPGPQHRVHGARGLPDPPHPPHPVEERPGERRVAEEVVVEEVQVPAGQALDLRERVVHRLHVEADLDSVLLYGSQARGEASAGSDVDVLCIMKKSFDYGDLIRRTSLATAEISLAHDVVISRVFVTREAYASQDSPFLMNVRKEQVAI